MNDSPYARMKRERRGWCALALAVAWIGVANTAAEARAIKSTIHVESEHTSGIMAEWLDYLSAGPSLWTREVHPNVSQSIRATIDRALASPDPLQSEFVDYLEWKRSLDPIRFDHYHPRISPELAQLITPTATSTPTPTPPPPEAQTVTSPPSTPSAPQTITTSVPPVTSPPDATVPEPSPLLISFALIGSGVWWRWRTKPPMRSAA